MCVIFCRQVIFLVLFVLVQNGDSRSAKRMVVQNARTHLQSAGNNTTLKQQGRGFLWGGGLLSLGKVLNFFPVGGERECQPEGYSIAKAGICLNQYDCRQRDGRASGDCAHGLGVCCVFEVSCGGLVQNNLTYFMSPGFPELWNGEEDCNISIEKTYAGIMQLRIDFIHFTIGQPNRTSGVCDEDAMILGDGESKFTLCGQNHGQHVYYTLSTTNEKRESDELAGTRTINLSMRMRGGEMPRLWLMRLAQMPLAYTAPHDCLQYYTSDNGTIKTFNYATNGRHLSSQEYRACIRKNTGFCSIRYRPCNERGFRIGSGSGFGGGPSPVMNPVGMDPEEEQMMPADDPDDDLQDDPQDELQEDEMEGSGGDPAMAMSEPSAEPGYLSTIWSYMTSWMWGQGRSLTRWSPYIQHYVDDDKIRYIGYGSYGAGLMGYGRQRCQDRVTIPCENDYFISRSYVGAGVCDPHHCGNNFCPGLDYKNCYIETSISPFAVSVHFSDIVKPNPEDNIGMCLRYTQVPCES